MRRRTHILHTTKLLLPAAALALVVGCAEGDLNAGDGSGLDTAQQEAKRTKKGPRATYPTSPVATDPVATDPGTTEPAPPPATVVPDQMTANFDAMPVTGFGSVTKAALETEVARTLNYAYQIEELSVADDGQGGKYLRQRYVPNETGSKVVEFPVTLPGANELWLSYRVYFEPGFQFVMGGKLPGLGGGTLATGGDFDPNGFSARMMWRQNGTMSLYAYHHDRPEKWGEDFFLVNADGTRWQAPTGQWLTIRQRIKMNSSGTVADGEGEVWVNGERRLLKTGIRWRTNTNYSADRFLYSSFYGGSDASWSPSTTTYARFDEFKVATSASGVE